MKNQINTAAPVQSAKSIFINAEPEIVWKILTDIRTWPEWQTDITKVVLAGEIMPGINFQWKTGGATITSTLHTVNPNSEFGWTGKTFGLFAVHNWRLGEENGGTILNVEESMEGVLAMLFRKSFNRNLEKGMQLWLDLLKRKCEQA